MKNVESLDYKRREASRCWTYMRRQDTSYNERRNLLNSTITLGWMNDLVGAAIPRKPFEEYRSPLAELARLEETTSQIVEARGIARTQEYTETLRPFLSQIDRAQEKRKRNARKLFSRRKAGETFGKPVDLLVFDILFDPF
jgi:hypothetical protein